MRKIPTLKGANLKKAALWGLLTTSTIAGTCVLALWFNGEFKVTSASPIAVEKKHEEVSQSAKSFALQFAHEYFKWSVGLPEQREERLKLFLSRGMDPQAGLDFSKVTFHARPEQITIWKTETLGEGKSVITVAALVNYFDPKDQNNYFAKRLLLDIPIKEKNGLAVIDNPKLVPFPLSDKPEITWKKDELAGQRVEHTVENEIRAAAETFFKAYADARNKELHYLMKKPTNGFKGSVQFDEVKQIEVSKQGEHIFSNILVQLSDSETGMTISVPYKIEWENQDGRWIVINIQ